MRSILFLLLAVAAGPMLAKDVRTVTAADGKHELVLGESSVAAWKVEPRAKMWEVPVRGSSVAWDISSPPGEGYDLFVSRDRRQLVWLDPVSDAPGAVVVKLFHDGALVREYRLEELLSSQTLGPKAPGWCHSAYLTIGQGDRDEFILSVRYPEGGHAEKLLFDPRTGKLHDRSTVVATMKPWQFWSLIVSVFALFIGAAIFVGRRKPSRK